MYQSQSRLTLLTALLLSFLCFSPRVALTQDITPPVDTKPDTESGGSRDGCTLGNKPLTALIPGAPTEGGSTVADNPTFFFYIPQTSAQSAEFILTDKSDRQIYKTTVKLPSTPGVIGLTIPAVATSSTLQVGQKYHWTFLLICKLGEHGNDVQVNGTVQRVQLLPAVAARLGQVKERDRPSVYGEAGLWYDMLFTLAELRLTNPQDAELTSYWTNRLKASGLAQVAQEPLVQLCQPEQCLTLPESFSDMRSDAKTWQN